MNADVPIRLRPVRPCAICTRPTVQKFHPFCSGRCAQIDLGKWLGNAYAIPAEDQSPPDEAAQPSPPHTGEEPG